MKKSVEPEVVVEKKVDKKVSHPGWLNLDIYDLLISLYLVWFISSVIIIFGSSNEFLSKINISKGYDKFLIIYLSFILLTISSKTVLGMKGMGKLLLRFFTEPAYITYYVLSFLNQLRSTYKKMKNNIPLKIVFIAVIPVLYIVGATSLDKMILKIVFILLSIHLLMTLFWGVKWSLNPFDFFKYASFLNESKFKTQMAVNLVKLDSKDKKGVFSVSSGLL